MAGELPSPWSTPPAGFTHLLKSVVRLWGGRHKKKKMLAEIFGVGTIYFMFRRLCQLWGILPSHSCVSVCSLLSVIPHPGCPLLWDSFALRFYPSWAFA